MSKKNKGLTVFSLTMLTLGTVIGGSFFLGVAVPIKTSGPSVIIAFLYCGLLIYFILFALSELTVNNPTMGSFRIYAEKAFGRGAGFVVGWVYYTGLIISMSSEAVAVSILFQVFFPNLPVSIIGSIVIFLIIVINLLGTEKLSALESALAGIKLITILAFIFVAVMLITGLLGKSPVGLGEMTKEPFFAGGITGLAGSMLIVMFAYAGFEIVGLAATETAEPKRIIPRAILFTVLSLLFLYIISAFVILPLIPVSQVNESRSPFVAALLNQNITFAAKIINVVLIIAIISTMLASVFGLARMLRSLAEDHYAPHFLKDEGNTPYKGIIVSGLAIFVFFSVSFFLPKAVYLFLVSSGGFSLLFTYLMIVLSHYRYRKQLGTCRGNCQLPIFPFSSWFTIISLILILLSMPFVKGQGAGLIMGGILVLLFTVIYLLGYRRHSPHNNKEQVRNS